MKNTNYRKGRYYEYFVCNKLREQGYFIVQRTAGSRSPFDIIAIDKKNKIIKLIQCKSGKKITKHTSEAEKVNKELSGTYTVEYELWEK